MPISDGKFKKLTVTNVDHAPRKPGVYALYADKTLVFLGSASGKADTLRSALRSHLRAPPVAATRYKREPSTSADVRLKALLEEHVANHGRLPTGNTRGK